MTAKVSVKCQTVIPQAIRDQARIKAVDQLEVGCAHGLIVMRKRRARTPARVRACSLRSQPAGNQRTRRGCRDPGGRARGAAAHGCAPFSMPTSWPARASGRANPLTAWRLGPRAALRLAKPRNGSVTH